MKGNYNKTYTGPRPSRVLHGEITAPMDRVRKCKYCPKSIVFIRSERTGKLYPVNYDGEINGQGDAIVTKNDFHHCHGK